VVAVAGGGSTRGDAVDDVVFEFTNLNFQNGFLVVGVVEVGVVGRESNSSCGHC